MCQISSQSDLWCKRRGHPKNAFSSLSYSATIWLNGLIFKIKLMHIISNHWAKFLAHASSREFELKWQTTNNKYSRKRQSAGSNLFRPKHYSGPEGQTTTTNRKTQRH